MAVPPGVRTRAERVIVQPLQQGMYFLYGTQLWFVVLAGVAVFALACVNLSTLLLARARSAGAPRRDPPRAQRVRVAHLCLDGVRVAAGERGRGRRRGPCVRLDPAGAPRGRAAVSGRGSRWRRAGARSLPSPDLFDSLSTFMGVSQAAGLVDRDGQPINLRKGLLVDAVATLGSGLAGTSSGTTYIESVAGIRMGGRRGLTSVATAMCFLPCLFLAPLAAAVPGFATRRRADPRGHRDVPAVCRGVGLRTRLCCLQTSLI
jgi:hypothetical protein